MDAIARTGPKPERRSEKRQVSLEPVAVCCKWVLTSPYLVSQIRLRSDAPLSEQHSICELLRCPCTSQAVETSRCSSPMQLRQSTLRTRVCPGAIYIQVALQAALYPSRLPLFLSISRSSSPGLDCPVSSTNDVRPSAPSAVRCHNAGAIPSERENASREGAGLVTPRASRAGNLLAAPAAATVRRVTLNGIPPRPEEFLLAAPSVAPAVHAPRACGKAPHSREPSFPIPSSKAPR